MGCSLTRSRLNSFATAVRLAGSPETCAEVRNATTGDLERDYALISLLPGTGPTRYIIALGGLSTFGTQGAAELASSPDSMALLEKMRAPADSLGPCSAYSEALLTVEIRDRSVAKVDCLFVRSLHEK